MKKQTIYGILAAAAVAAQPVAADDLNRTIDVEKETEVVEHRAEKLQSLPAPAALTARTVTLDFSDWAIPASLDPSLVTQSPSRLADGFSFSEKRGYATFGMGNYWNITGNAGYRILDKDDMALSVWMQHNSTDGTISGKKKFAVDDRFGVNFMKKFDRGALSANAGYHLDKFNYYGGLSPETADPRQRVNEGGFDILWDSPAGDSNGIGYYGAVGYNYFGYKLPFVAADPAAALEPLSEHALRLRAGVEVMWNDDSFVGIDAAFRRFGYSDLYELSGSYNPILAGGESNTMTTVTPYYRKNNDRLNLRIGARLDIAGTGTTLRIAPDVKMLYAFNSRVAVELSATGGNRINTFSEVAERNRYVNPSFRMANTYTLVDAEAKINVGLWGGFSFSPFIGFAVVKDALTPIAYNVAFVNYSDASGIVSDQPYRAISDPGASLYTTGDLNGIKAGFELTYRFRDVAELKAGYTFTPQDDDSGYIAADDRAEHAVKASLKVTPIKRLDVYADYAFRSGRGVLQCTVYDPSTGLIPSYEMRGIGVVSDLGIGATYRFNSFVRAYAQGNNLLNRKWDSYYGMPAQRAGFIVGVGLNF